MIWDISNPLLLKIIYKCFSRKRASTKVQPRSEKIFTGRTWKIHIPTNHIWKLFTEWLSLLLQIRRNFVSTKWGRIITNWGIFITNRDGYYKSMQILQIGAQNTSIVVGSFLLDLKTITMNFEISIFCNILKDNVHRQVYSKKY